MLFAIEAPVQDFRRSPASLELTLLSQLGEALRAGCSWSGVNAKYAEQVRRVGWEKLKMLPASPVKLNVLKPSAGLGPGDAGCASESKWFAVFTLPRNEKSAVRQLEMRGVETFLPTYDSVKVWKNRQKVRTVMPLFPTYLFVHIERRQRTMVLQSPGVIQIVGNNREDLPVAGAEIEFLRASVHGRKVEPYRELAIGKKVRIKRGSMEGVEGVLVRKGNGLRFVLSLRLINQCAAIEVPAEDLEQVAEQNGHFHS